MNKILIVLCVSLLLLLGGLVGLANAYTGLVEATFLIDGVDLDFGDVYRDKSILIVVYESINELDELLKPPEDDFIAFDPSADIYFEFDPTQGISLVFALEETLNQPNITGVAKIKGTSIGDVSPDIFLGLNFDEGLAPVFFDEHDTVVLRTSANEYIAIGLINRDEFDLTVQIGGEGRIIPEPSTLLLLGLGLLGLVGIIRKWRTTGKRAITLLLLVTIVGTAGVLLLCGAEPVAAQETFKITIIKKCLEITLSPEGDVLSETESVCDYGTVRTMKGNEEWVCASDCESIPDVPFSKNNALILKAEGEGFAGWRANDEEVEGMLKVNDSTPESFNLDAFFVIKYEVPEPLPPTQPPPPSSPPPLPQPDCRWKDPSRPWWWPLGEKWPPPWGRDMSCQDIDSLSRPWWWPSGLLIRASWPPIWWSGGLYGGMVGGHMGH